MTAAQKVKSAYREFKLVFQNIFVDTTDSFVLLLHSPSVNTHPLLAVIVSVSSAFHVPSSPATDR